MQHIFRHATMIAAIALAFFAVAGFVPYTSGLNFKGINNNQSVLQAAFAQASCKSNFTVAYVDDAIGLVPSFSVMNSSLATLKQDTSQLDGYVSQDNASLYRSYLRGTFDPELTSITQQFKSVKKNATISNSTRHQLKADYNSTKAAESSCEFSAVKQYADLRISIFEAVVAQYQQLEQNITAKGVGGAGMSSTIQGAQNDVITPLQGAINSATNVSQLKTAVDSYCLFNGCDTASASGAVDYHLAANFDYQKLSAILAYIQASGAYANQTANITAAQGYLNNASTMLAQVGTSKYVPPQNATVWDNLGHAASTIRSVLKK